MSASEYCNIPDTVKKKIGKNIYKKRDHPLCILKEYIYKYFMTLDYQFEIFEDFSPYVNIEDNFDKLLIEKTHPSRSKSDTYYLNESQVLRTHTSAHQNELLLKGKQNFLVCGDVYRKDEVDKSHYFVFHQIEGVFKIKNPDNPIEELKIVLSGLVTHLFSDKEYKFKQDYFPFTEPSLEVKVKFNTNWLEILGCGIVHKKILENNNVSGVYGAFGLGLERLAMILFNIPDIRYFWSENPKLISQFKTGISSKFIPYSELPNVNHDISFYISKEDIQDNKWLVENDFFEIIRNIGEEYIQCVKLLETYHNSKLDKTSKLYRIEFQAMDNNSDMLKYSDPAEFFSETKKLMDQIKTVCSEKLNITLR